MFSDNGLNFVGGLRIIKEFEELQNRDLIARRLNTFLLEEGIKWNFILPRAPHQGGLWESSVKQMKCLLQKAYGNQMLSIMEWTRILPQIEGVMNSRPLCKNWDQGDLVPTPAHFLVFRSMQTFPDRIGETNQLVAGEWLMINQLLRSFWKGSREYYLQELQKRVKWTKEIPNVRVGDVVLIRDVELGVS